MRGEEAPALKSPSSLSLAVGSNSRLRLPEAIPYRTDARAGGGGSSQFIWKVNNILTMMSTRDGYVGLSIQQSEKYEACVFISGKTGSKKRRETESGRVRRTDGQALGLEAPPTPIRT